MTLASQKSIIEYVCRINEASVLCWGVLNCAITGDETFSIDELTAFKPYFAAKLTGSEPPRTAMLLHTGDSPIHLLQQVAVSTHSGVTHWVYDQEMDDHAASFAAVIEKLPVADRIKLFYLMVKFAAVNQEVARQEQYTRMCYELRCSIENDACNIVQHQWLTDQALYLEVRLPKADYSQARTVLTTAHGGRIAISSMQHFELDISSQEFGLYGILCHFNRDAHSDVNAGYLSLLFADQLIPLQKVAQQNAPDIAAFIQFIKSLPETRRLDVRDFINRGLIELQGDNRRSENKTIICHLQHYLLPQHTSVHELQSPFGINVEAVIPVTNEGVLIAGWMFDPFNQLESLTLLCDSGLQRSCKPMMQRYNRDDVMALYGASPFLNRQEKHGFMAMIPFSQEQKSQYQDFLPHMSYRVRAELKGGIRYVVAPAVEQKGANHAQLQLLERVAPHVSGDAKLEKQLAEIASKLQQQVSTQGQIAATHVFGAMPKHPTVSIICPLYNNYEYIQAQLSQFVADESMPSAEWIYVLDSPEHEEAVCAQLQLYAALYAVPVKLLVMNQNCGYATATNLGASQAQGEWLLLLNSDVVAIENGWLAQLQDYLQEHPEAGAVAPKLLYEDESIQHAGMFFERELASGLYENKHFYKGYPSTYPPANESGRVPAISAACMLLKRSVFNEVGKLATDYVLGDYEDSDFCLKLYNKDLECHYIAEVVLYHFERQSFSKRAEHQQSRYALNRRMHHQRWEKTINQINAQTVEMKHVA